MEKYDNLEKIGEGTYGTVYKAIEKHTGNPVAIKKHKKDMSEEGIPSTTLREISLLKKLSESIYIVKLLSVEMIPSNYYLVFEYLETDLKKFIDSRTTGRLFPSYLMEPSLVKRYMFQLCKGVEYCHSHGVLHRDLKPSNLLLDTNKSILKIGDLGLGRAFDLHPRSLTPKIGTLQYRAPEILLGSTSYSTAIDVWSVGCIFAKMIRGQVFFGGDSEIAQLFKIFKLLGTPTEKEWPGVTSLRNWHEYPNWKPKDLSILLPSLSPEGLDLLKKMLRYNPYERIDARTALDHPYFDSLDKSKF